MSRLVRFEADLLTDHEASVHMHFDDGTDVLAIYTVEEVNEALPLLVEAAAS